MSNPDFSKYGREGERLEFMYNRDGLVLALKFAKQTLTVYRKCFVDSRKKKKKHFCMMAEYRPGFIQSYLACKKFYLEYKHVLESAIVTD